jgi:hypothetical protein
VSEQADGFSDDIKAIFDRQLNKMIKLIDHQMNRMAQVAPNCQIAGFLHISRSYANSGRITWSFRVA